MPTDGTSDLDGSMGISRRQAIQLMGTSATLALAGCAGVTNDGGGGGEGGLADGTLTMYDEANPEKIQWNNYYGKKVNSRVVRKHLFDPLAKAPSYTSKVDPSETVDHPDLHPVMAKEWSIDGETASVTLKDGYKWHNGDDVTAKDVVTQFTIEKHLELPTWSALSGVSAADEKTVEFSLASTPVNESILFVQLLAIRPLTTPASIYKEHVKKLENGGKAAKEEFINTKIEEPIGNGPFKIDDVASQQYKLVAHDGHPASDAINYDVEVAYVEEVERMQQGLKSDELDAVERYPVPKKVQKEFPDHVETFPFPAAGGGCILFNLEKEPWSNRNVRKAFAWLIDRKKVAENALDWSVTPRTITGLPPGLVESWVGGDFLEANYEIYEPNQKKAETLLKGEGFTRENGTWLTPDGEELSAPIVAPNAGTYDDVGESAAAMLSEFGINAELVTKSSAAYGQAIDNGDFELVVTMHGSGQMHYYTILQDDFNKRKLPPTGMSMEREVPMPVGSPDGDLQTVNLQGKIDSLVTATSEKETQQLLREITWVYNQDVPSINPHFWVVTDYLTSDHWDYPDPTDEAFFNAVPLTLPKLGKLTATEK